MIRITAGRFRGRRLAVPARARPTSEKARKAVFDILGPSVVGSRVLDAAAGSGAFGLEAISRGARQAVLVDSDPGAVKVIRRNAADLGLGDEVLVVAATIEDFLARGPDVPFDVVFHDPPYGRGTDPDLPGLAGAVASGGVLFHERGDDDDPWPEGGPSCDRRTYGDTRILVYRR